MRDEWEQQHDLAAERAETRSFGRIGLRIGSINDHARAIVDHASERWPLHQGFRLGLERALRRMGSERS